MQKPISFIHSNAVRVYNFMQYDENLSKKGFVCSAKKQKPGKFRALCLIDSDLDPNN